MPSMYGSVKKNEFNLMEFNFNLMQIKLKLKHLKINLETIQVRYKTQIKTQNATLIYAV